MSRRSAGAIVGSVLALFVAVQVGFEAQKGLPWPEAPYNGNAGTPAQYAAVGAGIRPLVGDHPVQSPGEVGTITYSHDKPASGHYWPLTGPSWIGNGYNILLPASK